MRKFVTFGLAMGLSAGTALAAPFSDVPRNHWAYGAVQRAADAGILQGADGKFHGTRIINRFQMAMVIQRILENVARKGGLLAAGMDSVQTAELEMLVTVSVESTTSTMRTFSAVDEPSFVTEIVNVLPVVPASTGSAVNVLVVLPT